MKTLKFSKLTAVKPVAQAIVANLTLVTSASSVEINTAITFTATLTDPVTGAVSSITALFQVPIQDPTGAIVLVKGVSFTAGVATISLCFAQSGYYCLTDDGINSKLPSNAQINLLTPLEITVYE